MKWRQQNIHQKHSYDAKAIEWAKLWYKPEDITLELNKFELIKNMHEI